MKTVSVSAPALRELLEALSGPGHLIRELQMLRGPLVGKDNPINILVAEFNASVEATIHTDDMAVDRFAAAMKAKLASARAKGRSGWDDPERCTVEHLSELLHGHLAKGDPVDVANFCMMLSARGSGIVQPPQASGEPPAQKCGVCGYSGAETDHIGQCPKCHWDELQPTALPNDEPEVANDELLEFVTQISEWHEKKVTNLRIITAGTGPFTLKAGDDVATELTAREAALFRGGMEAVLMELGKLPFSISANDDGEDDEAEKA